MVKTKKTKVNTSGLKYEDIKKLALNAEPMTKVITLSQIDVDNKGAFSVDGEKLPADEKIANQLYKIINVQPAFIKRFGSITNTETANQLVSMIKSGLSLKGVGEQRVTVVGNPHTKVITHLIDGTKDYIANKFAIEQFEKIMNAYPALSLQNFEINSDGSLVMNVISKNEITPKGKTGFLMRGEEYNPGLTFSNSLLEGMHVDTFTYRLVCTNGMTALVATKEAKLTKLSDKALDGFFNEVKKLGANDFASTFHDERIEKATHQNASFAELLDVRQAMIYGSALKAENVGDFLPEFSMEAKKLAAKGFDYAKCSDRQLENLPIHASVWDIINRLTDFGSHDYGFSANFNAIQRSAGRLFCKKEYDTEGLLLANLN